MTRNKALIIVLLLFLLSTLLRLPNLNRTVSKHHEFNTAVVLINMESWRQAGGASKFHFVPFLNYQNPGDKIPDRSHYAVDSSGNAMYISFGPAWYVIPYFIYNLFDLPIEPLYLQIINLIFNLASVVLFFYLLEMLIPFSNKNKYATIVLCSFLFLYSPCMLWYLGNGYINVGLMLPFVIIFFILILPMLHSPEKITAGKLFLLSLTILTLIYFDWFILGVCGIIGIYLLFRFTKSPKYFWLLTVLALSCITGIALLFWQFASYAGWHAVTTYWSGRFGSRSIANTSSSLELSGYFFQNFITAYLPLLLLLSGAFIFSRIKKIKIDFSENEKIFIGLYSASAILYNLVLFEWSSEHEYSVVPWSILFSFLAAKFSITLFNKKQFQILMAAFFITTMSQYYFINRPGKISREGTPYISYKSFGDSLRQIPPDYKIFINMKQNPMIEYYAKRNICIIPGLDSATRYMQHWNISKAAWIEHDNFDFKKIIYLGR